MNITEALEEFLCRWHQADVDTMLVQTSGSTGVPKAMFVPKVRMRASAEATLRFLGLKEGDTALLCLPLKYIAGQMMVVRAEIGRLHLLVVEPSSRPLATLADAPHFAAMTPMQVYESLQHVHDAALLREIRHLLIGGGATSAALEKQLIDFPYAVWSTYGMTETLSHIALRRLNGVGRSSYYRPLAGVNVSLNAERQTLDIFAPHVCSEVLHTHDVGEIRADGSFVILGRVDNVVCSGGIKLQIEQLETRLVGVFTMPYALTYVVDARLGQALSLIYTDPISSKEALARCATQLARLECPQYAFQVESLPLTATHKPARVALHSLAEQLVARN